VISGTNNYNENLTYDLRGNIQTLQRTGFYTNGSSCTYGQIDNLTYSYKPNTNRLHKVLDSTTTPGNAKSRGFNGLLSTIDSSMTYDRNGNLNKNLHKNVSTITYNYLNLPTVITFTTGNTIEFLYDASGAKLRKTVKVGATVQYIQDYLPSSIEYRQTGTGVKRVESVFHAEGRYYNTNVDASNTLAWRKEYNFKDHLGNTRLVFTDRNANGVVDITGTASTSDVLQENHYYSFGLAFEGAWLQNDATARDNKYQYNGKELNDDFGLNWNDYGARWYDAGLGRFTAVDRFTEKYFIFSSYQYAANNPISFIDINGDSIKLSQSFLENKLATSALKSILKTKEGYEYFSKFAAKGDNILGYKFTQDGEYSKQSIDLNLSVKDLPYQEGTTTIDPDNNPSNGFDINITLKNGKNDQNFPLPIFHSAETIIHEVMMHGDDGAIRDIKDDGKRNYSNISSEAKRLASGNKIHYDHKQESIDSKINRERGVWPQTGLRILINVNQNLKLGLTPDQVKSKMLDYDGN
jgi:RHS repeat-associated protein